MLAPGKTFPDLAPIKGSTSALTPSAVGPLSDELSPEKHPEKIKRQKAKMI